MSIDFYTEIYNIFFHNNPAVKISNFSSLFEAFMAIGFGFFALTNKKSSIITILEKPAKELIEKMNEREETLSKSTLTPNGEMDVDNVLNGSGVGPANGKLKMKLQEVYIDIRYNFLCLGIYCCVMLLCCGFEEYFVSPTMSNWIRNFVFNYSLFIIILFFYRLKTYDSQYDEVERLMREYRVHQIALLFSVIFSFLINTPLYTSLISILIVVAIFSPAVLHTSQYYKLRKEVRLKYKQTN